MFMNSVCHKVKNNTLDRDRGSKQIFTSKNPDKLIEIKIVSICVGSSENYCRSENILQYLIYI